jgi:hypothetical protein
MNTSKSATEIQMWKVNHLYVQNYCTLCEQTWNQQFNKTLQTTACRYFDQKYCQNNCNSLNGFVCVYYETFPMCYSYYYNRFVAHPDFLHLFWGLYYSMYDDFVSMGIYTFYFLNFFFLMLIPNLISSIYTNLKNQKKWYNKLLANINFNNLIMIAITTTKLIVIIFAIIDFVTQNLGAVLKIGLGLQLFISIWSLFNLLGKSNSD